MASWWSSGSAKTSNRSTETKQRTQIQSNMDHLYTKTETITTIKIDVIHEAEA